jgi:hypothetical protein
MEYVSNNLQGKILHVEYIKYITTETNSFLHSLVTTF